MNEIVGFSQALGISYYIRVRTAKRIRCESTFRDREIELSKMLSRIACDRDLDGD